MFFSAITVPGPLSAALTTAVEQARIGSGMKHETLAALMGITPVQLSQQLRGQGHLSLPRLLMVATDADGRVFWQRLIVALGDLVGAEDTDAIAWELKKVVSLLAARMARAAIGHSETERRSA